MISKEKEGSVAADIASAFRLPAETAEREGGGAKSKVGSVCTDARLARLELPSSLGANGDSVDGGGRPSTTVGAEEEDVVEEVSG